MLWGDHVFRIRKIKELLHGIISYIRSHLWVSIMGSLLLLIFAGSYLLILWQPMLVVIVPGAANVVISKFVDPILDQHMPKKEG